MDTNSHLKTNLKKVNIINERHELILRLEKLRQEILLINDRDEIGLKIQETSKLALPITPLEKQDFHRNISPNYKSKKTTLKILSNEISDIVKNNLSNIKNVHLQISASLLTLMLPFANGLHGVKQIIENDKEKN